MIPNKNWRKLFFLKPRATLSHTSNRKKWMCVIFFYFALSFFPQRDNLCGIYKDPYRMVKIYDSWNYEDLCILILIVNNILFLLQQIHVNCFHAWTLVAAFKIGIPLNVCVLNNMPGVCAGKRVNPYFNLHSTKIWIGN